MNLCLAIREVSRVLFVGIGGGGDVVTAAVLALSFERCGGDAFIGTILWERFSVDPIPGPIKFQELVNVEQHDGYVKIFGNSYAIRGGRKIAPQAANVARALHRPIVGFDIWGGPRSLRDGIEKFLSDEGIDLVIGVDVGGDTLAQGYEDYLWSPLADSIGVAALSQLNHAIIAIASPGADGELPPEYVLERISVLARLGGLLGGYVYSTEDIINLERILMYAHTEASAIPLKAFKGLYGDIVMRKGSRRVKVTPLNIVVYLLKPKLLAKNTVAKYVLDAKDLMDAKNRLNSIGIYTELDLEQDIYEEILKGKDIESLDLVELRRKGIERYRRLQH